MNEKEDKLFQLIRKNPYITQQELAEALGLSRPAVANLISGLVRKGYIRGKAYVINPVEDVVCIGGANVDRKFHVQGDLQMGTSNPIRSSQTAGGVARNIAENLGRLGMHAKLLTVAGMDKDWDYIAEVSGPYMNLADVIQLPDAASGSYTAVLHENGDLAYGFADMDIFDQMRPEWLEKQSASLLQAKCILADLNCPKQTLTWLLNFANEQQIPLIFVTVSAPKMQRLPANLDGLAWMVTNLHESEAYFGEHLRPREAAAKWLNLGIANVVITNGSQSAVIGNQTDGIHHIPAIETAEVVDVTGAGDAFSAGIAYAWLDEKHLPDIASAGLINATKTLQSAATVRLDLSASQLQNDLEELS